MILCRLYDAVVFASAIAVLCPATTNGEDTKVGTLRYMDQAIDHLHDSSRASIPVDLEATVNLWDPGRSKLFVQDGNKALFVRLLDEREYLNPRLLTCNSRIRIRGTLDTDKCIINADWIENVGQGKSNTPQPIDLATIARGEYWSSRVQFTGEIRDIARIGSATQFTVVQNRRRINCFINSSIEVSSTKFHPGMHVSVIGVMDWSTHATGAPNRAVCQIMDLGDITVTDPAKIAIEAGRPTLSIKAAKARKPGAIVRLRGVIGFVSEGESFRLEDTKDNVSVQFNGIQCLSEGLNVELVGRVAVQGGVTTLDALWMRQTATKLSPNSVLKTSALEIVENSIDNRRVAINGILKRQRHDGSDQQLTFEDRGITFRGVVPIDDTEFDLLNIRNGCNVQITGLLTLNEESDTAWFTIRTSGANDLQVAHDGMYIERSSVKWWLSGFLAIAAIGAAWVATLKTQVHFKTKHLEDLTARLNASYDAINDGIVVIGQDGKIASVNQRFKALSQSSVGPGCMASQLADDLRNKFINTAEMLEFIGQIESGPGESQSIEIRGEQNLQMIAHLSPVLQTTGEVMGWLLTLQDTTEQKKLEAQLIQSQKMDAVGRLAGGVAHDFNNLLLGISANLELAQLELGETHEATEFLGQADLAAGKAGQLVDKLLGFSRQSTLKLDAVSLNRIVESVVSLIQRTVESTIRIQTKMEPELWLTKVDAGQMEQVLMNLCLNARDAIQNQVGEINIATSNEVIDGEEYVRLSVEDTGIGMPPEVQSRIFEPFFTTKPTGKGTGLGLSMSYGMVKQHGGTIRCYSEIGSGTQLEILIPRCNEVSSIEDAKLPSRIQPEQFSGKVLVVDDQEVVRKATTSMLSRLGFEVMDVDNGRSALEKISTIPFDLVILDLNMPEMNGREVFREISKSHPDLAVIICTGYQCEGIAHEQEMQPTAFLQKPFGITKFKTVLAQHFAHQAAAT